MVILTYNPLGFWRSSTEPLYVHTSPVWDEWNCRKNRKESQRRHFNYPLAARTRWTVVGSFYGMLLLLCNVEDLSADGKTPHERRFGEKRTSTVIRYQRKIRLSYALRLSYGPHSVRGRKLLRRPSRCRRWGITGEWRFRGWCQKNQNTWSSRVERKRFCHTSMCKRSVESTGKGSEVEKGTNQIL